MDQSHIPLDTCMAWDTPIGLGPVTDCHQLSGGGPQTSGSADRRDQEAAAGLKGGAAPCVRVWPFSRRNSVFLTNRVRERIFSARKGSLWTGRGRPGQTEVDQSQTGNLGNPRKGRERIEEAGHTSLPSALRCPAAVSSRDVH